jgi:hypothetical protein
MKRLGFALCVAYALIAGSTGIASAHLHGSSSANHGSIPAYVDINYFYDTLEPYGFWVTVDPYGFVWVPTDVSVDWQPYTDGYWTYTDYGWTWVDDADWGWAPFHYGRWAHDRLYGWVWVPDTVWGPAWVAWRVGDGIVGWAPLPPEAYWQIGVGFVTDDWRFGAGIGLGDWCFVPDRHFLGHQIRRHCMPRDHADHYFRVTRDATDYGYVQERIVDRGIAVRDIEQRTGQRVRQHIVRPPVSDGAVRPQRQVTEEQQPKAQHEQERAQLERRHQPSSKRADARRSPTDQAQVQKEQKKATEQQQKEQPKLEQRQARERQQERTRRR